MVLGTLKDRLMRSCGPSSTIYIPSTDTRSEHDAEQSKHISQVNQAIHDVEEQFTPDSDSASFDADNSPIQQDDSSKDCDISHCLAALHVGIGEQFDPGACASDCYTSSSNLSSPCKSTRRADNNGLGKDHDMDTECSTVEKSVGPSPCVYSPGQEMDSCGPSSHFHTTGKGGKLSQTPSSGSPEGKRGLDPKRGKRRATEVDIGHPKKRSKQPDKEFPNLFWLHDPVRYRQYVCSCSRGQRLADFFKNSLKKHWGAGHFHNEFGSPRLAEEAYFRVMDARGGHGDKEGHYKAKRLALWGTPLDEPISPCLEYGEHELSDVDARVIRYPELPRRASDADGSQPNPLTGDEGAAYQEENLDTGGALTEDIDSNNQEIPVRLAVQLPHGSLVAIAAQSSPEVVARTDLNDEHLVPFSEIRDIQSQIRKIQARLNLVESARGQGSQLQQTVEDQPLAAHRQEEEQRDKDINHEDASDILDQYESASFARGQSSSYSWEGRDRSSAGG